MDREPWRIRIAELSAKVFGISALCIGALLTFPLILLWWVCDKLEWRWRGMLWRGTPGAERWWWRHKF